MADGQWSHVVALHTDGINTLFIDGSEDRSTRVTNRGVFDTNLALYVGHSPAFGSAPQHFDGAIDDAPFQAMIEDAYKGFGHPATAPLVQLEDGLWLMELFHGPTLAFKDYPLQLVGRLFDHVLQARRQRVTIIGATSGDTGSAAIEGCRHCDNLDIFILHPHNRVSEVQRRQMTTVLADNVFN